MKNVQSFSFGSEQYARYRPSYPAELFSYLKEIASQHDCAWDCATGNGQAALACAAYFARVEATDLSREQIQHAILHPRVNYQVGSAEQTSFSNCSFDLIVVAQALHWFNQRQFFQEARRVLRPEGILAVWGYSGIEISPEIDSLIAKFLLEPIDRFWADGNRQLMAGYQDVSLPFDEIRHPPTFVMQVDWNLGQLLAYLRTWSAVKRYSAELGVDPVARLEIEMKTLWMKFDEPVAVKMPLVFRVSRNPG